jgi:hypothetical protein
MLPPILVLPNSLCWSSQAAYGPVDAKNFDARNNSILFNHLGCAGATRSHWLAGGFFLL